MPEMPRRAVRATAAAFLLAAFLSGCVGAAFAAETLFDRAKNLYDVHEYKVALAYFRKVIESEPENGEAWDFAGWCHRYNGDWDSALKAFARAKELLPGELSKWVSVGEGEAYYGAGVYKEAVNAFARAISLAPGDEELAVRAAKGIIFAYAALNDKTSMEQALAGLDDLEAGKNIGDEAEALLARAQEKAAKDEAAGDGNDAQSAPKITDSNDRFLQAVEILTSGDVTEGAPDAEAEVSADQAPEVSGDDAAQIPAEPPAADADAGDDASAEAETPAKDADEPPAAATTEAKLWELPALGAPIADVLAKLGEDGISASKAEVETSEGLWIYTLAYPSDVGIPDIAGEKPDSKNVHIEEFGGQLLAVVIANGWENRENSVIFKDELFAGALSKLNAEIGSEAVVNETELLSEAQWRSADGRQIIALTVSAAFEGNVTAEQIYNDTAGLSVWIESLGTGGAD